VGLHYSEHLNHGSYFISCGLDGSLHQPHWNVGTEIPTIYIPITNGTKNTLSSQAGNPGDLSVPDSGSREHSLSLLLGCEREQPTTLLYDATLPLHISPEDNLSGEFHDSHAKRSISWGSTSR
jgi:hypothetical protein